MRRCMCVIVFVVGVTGVYSQGLSALSFGTDTTFEVLSWNLEWFAKNEETTVDYVTHIIESLDVDLVALQEIDKKASFEQLVKNLDGWEGYFADSDYLELGYLYKTGELDVSEIFEIFPNTRREFPREPLVMEMVYEGKEMVIINNHLKCCGDGSLNSSDSYDEEKRRLDAMNLLYQHINTFYSDRPVILLGDLNDILTDKQEHNVFQMFIDDPDHYRFADMEIAQGSPGGWSYPTWPSHIDHILITDELFDAFEHVNSEVAVLKIENSLEGGWEEYDQNISDHRPVGLKLFFEGSTGLRESFIQPGEHLSIQPNPVVHAATFSFSAMPEDGSLAIFDATGKKVDVLPVEKGQGSLTWEPGYLPGGFYVAELIAGNRLKACRRVVLLP